MNRLLAALASHDAMDYATAALLGLLLAYGLLEWMC